MAGSQVLVLVSKAAHCLNDLLFRQRGGELPIEARAHHTYTRTHACKRARARLHTLSPFPLSLSLVLPLSLPPVYSSSIQKILSHRHSLFASPSLPPSLSFHVPLSHLPR